MGSKRAMLKNGLGEALDASLPKTNRFVDLFTGSGSVACHVARRYEVAVAAHDLQHYAAALARAVIGRTAPTGGGRWAGAWVARGLNELSRSPIYAEAAAIQACLVDDPKLSLAQQARTLCTRAPSNSLTKAYGGYYFSPMQALLLDALLQSMPSDEMRASVAKAVLIMAASKAAAAPGHTAQPFKPNETAGPYLLAAWRRDIIPWLIDGVKRTDTHHAKIQGAAEVMDAASGADTLRDGDLAFVDPPYSAVHYSRFYHVLESIARGGVGEVSGAGRYPAIHLRPSSDYSTTTRAHNAMAELFQTIASNGARAIVTFPAGPASNGVSGDDVKDLADKYFIITESKVTSRFSTLGGDRKHREARQDASELILTLTPR